MNRRYFLFENGKIKETPEVIVSEGEKLYFHKSLRNFLELNDELKKLSFLCNGVYVSFSESDMEIFFFKRDSLELFTKLQLSSEPYSLEVNERLKDYLCSIED
ncbi:hypothetical protein CVD28_04070 [Bacillus sp. M6-12]|uniref:hypothetical protein n=1 Tax=Bacillus sp. M6-12 TaxID=2054166 RepID=UPI000C76EEBD|nr:hypothetical protein [Bacillus sp. M6-12]PLS19601.1 hypothetical protein CVD28_04070 [Bacillus sp. M6-12]